MVGQYIIAHTLHEIRVYDTANGNVQVGETILAGHNRVFRTVSTFGTRIAALIPGALGGGRVWFYDIGGDGQRVGIQITLSHSYRASWHDIAFYGTRLVALRADGSNTPVDRRERLLQVYDTTNGNQIGSDIDLGIAIWRDVAMFGSLIAAAGRLGSPADIILRIFDIDNNLQQVGSNISTGIRSVANLEMLDSLVAVEGAGTKVFDAW